MSSFAQREQQDYLDAVYQYNLAAARQRHASNTYNDSIAMYNDMPVVSQPNLEAPTGYTDYLTDRPPLLYTVSPDGTINPFVNDPALATYPTTPIPGSAYSLVRQPGTDVNGEYPTVPGEFTKTPPAPLSLTPAARRALTEGSSSQQLSQAMRGGGLIEDVIRTRGTK